LTTSLPLTYTTPERFDANLAALCGEVTRIWSRGGDVFARLDTGDPQPPGESAPNVIPRATLRFPGGQVAGREVSLLKGDRLRLSGYLVDINQTETLADFLRRADKLDLLQPTPELAELNAQARRAVTCIIPESLERVEAPSPLNSGCLEGGIAKVWDYDQHRFARLAIYDRHTQVTDQPGKNGRPRRIPHYVTLQFTNSMVGDRAVSFKPKDRLRISGSLIDRTYSENLRTFLLDARQAEVLARLPNSDDIGELRARRSSVCVVVQTMIQFTK